MNQPHDPNVTTDIPSVPADSLDAGLIAGFEKLADALGTTDHARGSASTDEPHRGAEAPAGDLPVVPGYRVLHEIARGGMGRVLAAFDLGLDRDVALKILLPGANGDRFVRESKITARLPHPGIPPVHALGTLADGSPFLAMKLIAGQTLAVEMKTADRPRLLQAFTQVCQAVGFAHSRGIIHRDLKPANVMVGAFGEVQVMDWGLAKDLTSREVADKPRASEALTVPIVGTDANQTTGPSPPGKYDDRTQAGQVMGTPAYMAPEQARSEPTDARADVFALGGILCAILTGQPPFVGKSTLDVIRRAGAADLAEADARLDGCDADADLIALCRRCLSPIPADRPANGQAVADELMGYLHGVQERLQAAERERAVAVAREAEERRRRRVQLALTGALLLLLTLGGGGGWYYARQETERVRVETELVHAVEDDLNRLARAREEGKWDEAEKILERGEGRLGQGGGAELRQRVQSARDELALVRRGQQMAAKLEDARLQYAAVGDAGFDTEGSRRRLEEAFAWYDLDVRQGSAEEIAARIAASPIREEVVIALDWWSDLAAPADAQRLRTIAQHADASAWRRRLRGAVLDKADDLVRRLADEAKVAELSPASILFLADALRMANERERGIVVLRAGRQRHPADFWLNFELAAKLYQASPPQAAEAVRYLTAAQALRPDSLSVLNNLGSALHADGKYMEAETAFREAIRLKPGLHVVHGNLGNALKGQGKLPEAVAEYRAAIRLQPHFSPTHYHLGNALQAQGKLPEAEAAYRASIRLSPHDHQALSSLGDALQAQHKLPEAVAAYHAAIRLKPDFPDAHNHLGILLAAQGKPPEAEAEFRKAIRLKPDFHGAYNNLALALEQQGKLPEAESACREAMRLKPDFAGAYTTLGVVLRGQRKLPEALAARREALRLKPDFVEAHTNLGLTLQDMGQLPKAVAAHREAIRLKSDYDVPHYNLGNALVAQGKMPEAIAEYRTAVRLKPGNHLAHINLGIALRQQGKIPDAVAAFREAIRVKPDYADTHNNLGNALLDQRKLPEAVAEYREAIRLKPDYADAHNNLGNALLAQRKLPEAEAAYRDAIRLKPHFPSAHNGLANAMSARGKLLEAEAACREAIRLQPDLRQAHCNLGTVLQAQGKLPEAEAAYREAIRLKPDYFEAQLMLSNALRDQGKLREAEAACRAAIQVKPDFPPAHYSLGMALSAQNKRTEAVAAYREAIRLQPTYAEAHFNLGFVLRSQGQLQASHQAIQRGHALGSKTPGWGYPSAEWVREAKHLADLERRLSDILDGKAKPASAAESIEFARVCVMKDRRVAAVRLYADAFQTDGKLADDLTNMHRYYAACHAVLASKGQAADAKGLPDKVRAGLRRQSLLWLRADLMLYAKLAEGRDPATKQGVRRRLTYLQKTSDLAAVRDDAVAKLPEVERGEWQKFWQDVDALLKRAGGPK